MILYLIALAISLSALMSDGDFGNSDHTLFRLYAVNKRLHSLQTIVIVQDSPSAV